MWLTDMIEQMVRRLTDRRHDTPPPLDEEARRRDAWERRQLSLRAEQLEREAALLQRSRFEDT